MTRRILAGILAASALIVGCSSPPQPSAPSSGVAIATAASDSDLHLCTALVAEFKSRWGSPQPIDYEAFSAELNTYAADVRTTAGSMKDPAMNAAWMRVADNGTSAAKELISHRDRTSAVAALTPFIHSTTAAMTRCTG